MRFLEALANVFINTFGITQPTDKTRRKAAWFIAALLLLTLAAAIAAAVVAFQLVRR